MKKIFEQYKWVIIGCCVGIFGLLSISFVTFLIGFENFSLFTLEVIQIILSILTLAGLFFTIHEYLKSIEKPNLMTSLFIEPQNVLKNGESIYAFSVDYIHKKEQKSKIDSTLYDGANLQYLFRIFLENHGPALAKHIFAFIRIDCNIDKYEVNFLPSQNIKLTMTKSLYSDYWETHDPYGLTQYFNGKQDIVLFGKGNTPSLPLVLGEFRLNIPVQFSASEKIVIRIHCNFQAENTFLKTVVWNVKLPKIDEIMQKTKDQTSTPGYN